MSGSKGPRQLPLNAEIPLAFAAGAAAFAAVALMLVATDSNVVAVLIAAAAAAGVWVIVRRVGVAYAVPVAIATLLAFDWFRLPPTHAHRFPPARDLLDLLAYLGVGVFVGVIATRAGRRAEATEVERSELADEQAALRRLATLVSGHVEPTEILTAVAREVTLLLDVDATHLGRYEPDGTCVGVGSWSRVGDHIPVGTRFGLEGENVTAKVKQTGRPARMDDYASASGEVAVTLRATGIRSSVGAPIFVEGRLWGVMIASTKREEPLAPDTESRIADFTELVASAISNTEAWAAAQVLTDEQAALRHVATLVAQDVPSSELFDAVVREMGTLLGADFAGMARFEDDSVVTVGVWAADGEHPPVPPNWPMQPGDPATAIAERRAPVRWDDWSDVPGPMAGFIREIGIRCSVGTPIVVEGRLWGAMAIHSKQSAPWPNEIEARMGQFTDLVATAIANRETRAQVERLAGEQASLRRLATLVARGAEPDTVFRAVIDEAHALLSSDIAAIVRFEDDGTVSVKGAHGGPNAARERVNEDPAYVVHAVRETGRAARFDTADPVAPDVPDLVRSLGIRSGLASPIVIDGKVWGAITVASLSGPLPLETERRLNAFTELVRTAVANTHAREQVTALADEQAALRRVATLVARAVPQDEVFMAIADEIARLLGADDVRMARFEEDESGVMVAAWGEPEDMLPVGARFRLDGDGVAARVYRTGQAARVDDYEGLRGEAAEHARAAGPFSVVGTPIVLEDRLWGAIIAGTIRDTPMPPETESRLGQFTDLMATAIANAESRGRADRLADEQAALRRVATLVAKEASLEEVFAKVAEQVANVLGDVDCTLARDEGDGTARIVATGGISEGFPVGRILPIEGGGVLESVLRSGRPHRVDDYAVAIEDLSTGAAEGGIASAVGCPIVVRERTWGAMIVSSNEASVFPPDTEHRIARFSELVATAIANTEARAEVKRLADEQTGLRRVATLVADGAAPTAVFAAVAGELLRVLGADGVTVSRFEADEHATVVAHSGSDPHKVPSGTRVSHRGENVTTMVRRSERPARLEHRERPLPGPIATIARGAPVRVSVGAPIVVEGRLWGVAIANWRGDAPPPADTEERMAKFAALLDTAIANADSRDQLTASRARLVTEGDEARRRLVRDLHDGAQQRLVHTVVTLKLAQRALRNDDTRAGSLVGEALEHAERGNEELRELAHGILPASLTRGGLRAAVDALVGRLDLPVDVEVVAERMPAEIEASAYFIVAEALTNVVKHAHAERAEVRATAQDGLLRVEVRDNGMGGADPDGHGLVGMADRVSALGGLLSLESPRGGGTVLSATLPLSEQGSPRSPAAR